MNDLLRLRDPSQPCGCTGEFGARRIVTRTDQYDVSTEYVFWTCGTCPGGREIVLRQVSWPQASIGDRVYSVASVYVVVDDG